MRKQYAYYRTIRGAIMQASGLLRSKKYDDGLNLATVERSLSWAWSTYTYLYGDIWWPQRQVLAFMLRRLGQQIAEFDWTHSTNQKDGYTIAMEFYEG